LSHTMQKRAHDEQQFGECSIIYPAGQPFAMSFRVIHLITWVVCVICAWVTAAEFHETSDEDVPRRGKTCAWLLATSCTITVVYVLMHGGLLINGDDRCNKSICYEDIILFSLLLLTYTLSTCTLTISTFIPDDTAFASALVCYGTFALGSAMIITFYGYVIARACLIRCQHRCQADIATEVDRILRDTGLLSAASWATRGQ